MTPDLPPPDLREKGRLKDGTPLFSNRRLWVQFLAFGDCQDVGPLVDDLARAPFSSTLYADLNDPWGVGLVRWSEDPAFFTGAGRTWMAGSSFAALTPKPDLTMTGRTYSIGYEANLDEVLVDRPRSRLTDPALAWGIWYPVRRDKAFESLEEGAKHDVMMDHGSIGMRYGKAGLGHDIRLACHGLDRNDADFVIAVLAPELHNASAVIQAMRKSLQTMHHLDALGPFFTGRVVAQNSRG
jgi:chlorite dismutase